MRSNTNLGCWLGKMLARVSPCQLASQFFQTQIIDTVWLELKKGGGTQVLVFVPVCQLPSWGSLVCLGELKTQTSGLVYWSKQCSPRIQKKPHKPTETVFYRNTEELPLQRHISNHRNQGSRHRGFHQESPVLFRRVVRLVSEGLPSLRLLIDGPTKWRPWDFPHLSGLSQPATCP